MKKGKLITIGGAIVVLALCGYFFMGTSSKGKISFQTEKVTRNSMTDVVVATGTVEPVTKVDVGTQVSGIIDRIYVDYNSVVKKGQLIADLTGRTGIAGGSVGECQSRIRVSAKKLCPQ